MLKLDNVGTDLRNKIVVTGLPTVILTEVLTNEQFMSLPDELRHVNMSQEHLLLLYIYRSNGVSVEAIAEDFLTTPAIISKILATAEYKSVVKHISDDIIASSRNHLQIASQKAAKVMSDLLESQDETIQFRAAKEILTMVGVPAPKKTESTGTILHMHGFTDSKLQEILEAGEKAKEILTHTSAETIEYVEDLEESDE